MALALTPITLLALACAGTLDDRFREAMYPPNFNYIAAEKLESTMWQLGSYASQLDRLLDEQRGEPSSREVARLLGAMDRAIAELGPGGWPSNHPRVSHNIERFRRDIAAAKRAVDHDPPSFFLAASVADSCTRCHQGS